MTAGRHASRLPMLAGWLFADLFLVLFVIGLALVPAKEPASSAPPRPSTTSSPSSPPVPTTTTRPRAPTLDRRPVALSLPVDVARLGDRAVARRLVTLVRQQLSSRGLRNRRVGFIMAFAPGPKAAIGVAQDRAMDAIRTVRAGIPSFAGAADPGEGYWAGETSQLELKLFFYA